MKSVFVSRELFSTGLFSNDVDLKIRMTDLSWNTEDEILDFIINKFIILYINNNNIIVY